MTTTSLSERDVETKTKNALSCLVVSPSDVGPEREAVTRAIAGVNGIVGDSFDTILEPVMWEIHATPKLGEEPQKLLNDQFVDRCQLAVGIFWSRLGTKTSDHASGSVEEISRLVAAGAPVSVFFCERPYPHDVDVDQLQGVRGYRNDLQQKGIVGTFTTVEELERKVFTSLLRHVVDLTQRAFDASPGGARLGYVSNTPDVRVFAEPWDIFHTTLLRRIPVVRIIVENHGTASVFLTGVSFSRPEGTRVMSESDSFGRKLQTKRELAPGDSLSFEFYADTLIQIAGGHVIGDVAIHDAIRRSFFSAEGALAAAFERSLQKGSGIST
jgi:hypothetical protein